MEIKKKNRLCCSKAIIFTLTMTNILGILGNGNVNAMNFFFNWRGPQITRRQKRIRNKFTPEEDKRLIELVKNGGEKKDWISIASQMPNRNSRQCRERYKNYISPDIRKDEWTEEEDRLLLEKAEIYGGKWGKTASFFNNRSPMQLKNRHYFLLKEASGKNKIKNNPSQNTDQSPPIVTPIPEVGASTNYSLAINPNSNDNNPKPFLDIFNIDSFDHPEDFDFFF